MVLLNLNYYINEYKNEEVLMNLIKYIQKKFFNKNKIIIRKTIPRGAKLTEGKDLETDVLYDGDSPFTWDITDSTNVNNKKYY
jgi:hypothetical protein